ncbi:MAG: hypothetical protein ACREAZ_04400 [Nitrososphaera sp.]
MQRLLNDRVAFRLYAAEQHLGRLKELETVHGGIAKSQARLEVEMVIDCFLSQIIGAVDSLLYQINSVFDLGVPHDRVWFQAVQSGLSAKTKQISLLNELDQARQPGNWFAVLSELRNQSMHRTFLRKVIIAHDFPPKPGQIKFLKVQKDFGGNPFDQVMQEDVIPYLESSLQKVESMIESIRKSEPMLQPS